MFDNRQTKAEIIAGADKLYARCLELERLVGSSTVWQHALEAEKVKMESKLKLYRELLEAARVHMTHTGNPDNLAERIALALRV